MPRGGLHPSRWLLARGNAGSQVVGAEVPSFRTFPYRAQDTLYLYRHFLQLIYHHYGPEERKDLLFRLRNEFSSKRHLRGPRAISAALKRGEGMLALQRELLQSREVRRGTSREGGAQSVDALWDQFQIVSGHVLPGLRNYENSLPVSHGSYVTQASTKNVYSRRQ
ncbi:hypothetical protein LSCM1_02779 [Leishmania martiniquensis]|uniref:Complex 1 LYR protein domain-containing protein n=1 Tax=Leishmania martiniquensis TaxID=1580590 RepID=A0A836H2A3_9TRYP|nr:hypothetical protein LSCM1_02779 [Leishmania martiniquensis]